MRARASSRATSAICACCALALILVLGADPAASSAGQAAAECDRGAEICLLSPGPWVSPQLLLYSVPAGAGRPALRWQRSGADGEVNAARRTSERGEYSNWAIQLPKRAGEGSIALTLTTSGTPALTHRIEGEVRPALRSASLGLVRRGRDLAVRLRARVRADVRATLRVRLFAARGHGGARQIGRWATVGAIEPDPARPLSLRIDRRSLARRCVTLLRCRLRVTAVISRAGTRVGTLRRGRLLHPSWRPRVAAAERYARGRNGTVRFAAVDPAGRLSGYRKSGTAPAASVIKAILMVAYLRRSDVRDRPLRGDERALIEPMIRRSDNGAAVEMARRTGDRAVERLARAAHMRDLVYTAPPGYLGGLSRISPRDQAGFFSRIEALTPARHRSYARRQLGSIVGWQRWGVADARPSGWEIYFKGGWGISDGRGSGTVNHQSALLRRGRCRVGISILTEYNPSQEYGQATLEGVARRLLKGIGRLPC